MLYPRDQWELLGFTKSKNKNKKYDAILLNKKNDDIKEPSYTTMSSFFASNFVVDPPSRIDLATTKPSCFFR